MQRAADAEQRLRAALHQLGGDGGMGAAGATAVALEEEAVGAAAATASASSDRGSGREAAQGLASLAAMVSDEGRRAVRAQQGDGSFHAWCLAAVRRVLAAVAAVLGVEEGEVAAAAPPSVSAGAGVSARGGGGTDAPKEVPWTVVQRVAGGGGDGAVGLLRQLCAVQPPLLRQAGGLPPARAARLHALVTAGALDDRQLVLLSSMPRQFAPSASAARALAAWALAVHDVAEAGTRQRQLRAS